MPKAHAISSLNEEKTQMQILIMHTLGYCKSQSGWLKETGEEGHGGKTWNPAV